MNDKDSNRIIAPEIKGGSWGLGYVCLLGLIDLIAKQNFEHYVIMISFGLAAILGLPQKHIIRLLTTERKFAFKTLFLFCISLFLFLNYEHPIIKLLALIPGLVIFMMSLNYTKHKGR